MGTYTPWVYDDFKGMKVVSAQNGTGTSGAASNSGFPEAPSSTADQGGLFVFLTQRAVEFRDEYKNNPYVQVSGFTVHVALIPSVDLSFSFK